MRLSDIYQRLEIGTCSSEELITAFDKIPDVEVHGRAFANICCRNGNLELLQWLITTSPYAIDLTPMLLEEAVRANQLDTVQWLFRETDSLFRMQQPTYRLLMTNIAANDGAIAMLRYFCEQAHLDLAHKTTDMLPIPPFSEAYSLTHSTFRHALNAQCLLTLQIVLENMAAPDLVEELRRLTCKKTDRVWSREILAYLHLLIFGEDEVDLATLHDRLKEEREPATVNTLYLLKALSIPIQDWGRYLKEPFLRHIRCPDIIASVDDLNRLLEMKTAGTPQTKRF